MGASINSNNRRTRSRRGVMSEINVTPFVDVILVLLIIFMVAAPMLTAGVTVDLPDSAASALPGDDEPLTLSVNAKGQIFVQETEVPLEELIAKLEAITNAKKDTRIFIRGDKQVDYGKVMQVMGAINAAGFSKVALVTAPMDSARR
ncbi:protein TolR [bacterium]|nr:protein TolR [bacterium]